MTAVAEDISRWRAMPLSALRDAVLAGDPGCLLDPELFTGPAGVEAEDEPPEDQAARIAVAREVCAACPVRLPCLAFGLRTRPEAGVWAGLTADEVTALADITASHPIRPTRRAAPSRPAGMSCGAAHSRQAIRRPATPSRRQSHDVA